MTKYAVTGATGFLGRHVVKALCDRGDEVVAIARGHEPVARGDGAPRSLGDEKGVRAVRADILDLGSLTPALQGCEGLFHCAGRVSRDPADAQVLQRVNVTGTRRAIEAAREAGLRRVIVASTSGTVAISENPKLIATEDSPTPFALIQRFPYYRSKLFAEQEALASSRDGLEVVSVNPALLLGPGDVFGSSTGDVRLFLDRAIPAAPAGGLAFVDARDAASAMLSAMTRGVPGRRYLLGAMNLTVRDFFERLARLSGVPAPRLSLPRSAAVARATTRLFGRALSAVGAQLPVDPVSVEMGQLFWYLSSARAERDLGFSPRDPLETLSDTIHDLRSAGRPSG